MHNQKRRIFVLLITNFYFAISNIIAQDSTKTVIFRAMKDEMDRSMGKLVYKDYPSPFYISYTIEDIKTLYVSANLGALNNSSEQHIRNWSNRVLAGDYQLNDENFVDATRRKAPRDGDLELPLDDDYYGIRRALWMVTNNTYKSASENYKSKLAALKDKNLTKQDLQIPDFCRVPVVSMSLPDREISWDKSNIEKLVKETSVVFKKYSDLIYSEVCIFQIHADAYFYSSENSKIKSPIDLIYYTAFAYCQALDGETLGDQLRYCAIVPSGLPNIDTIKNDIKLLAENLVLKSNAPVLNENYTGPVLFLGQSVADILSQGLFNGADNLCAYREPLYNSSQMSMYYGQNINSLESKLDKLVISKNISIKDISNLKTYQGSELIGNFDSDAEGVVPKDTLVLVENGILKSLYNGRTPTRNIKGSNGHRRYKFRGGILTSDLWRVLFITAKEGKPLDKLKEDLISAAKEENLDYAIIVKPLKTGNCGMPYNIYKVNIIDGKEELLRTAVINPIVINSLKKIVGISSNTMLFNTLINTGFSAEEGGSNSIFASQESIPNGMPVSFIFPDGLILKEVEFEHQTKPLSSDRPVVKSPLVR